MSVTLPQEGEIRPLAFETIPTLYISSVREFLSEHANATRVPTNDMKLQMQAEEERSRAFITELCADPAEETVPPEHADLISDGFSGVMALLVKASAKASDRGFGVVPFSEIDEDTQGNIRQYVFEEYLELCDTLSASDKPAKVVYESLLYLYHSPEDIRRIIEDNEDLGRSHIVHLLAQKPLSAEVLIEEARDKIDTAIEKFPTIPHSRIRTSVFIAPGAYEQRIKRYAESNGLVLDVEEQPLPDAGSFLQTLRQVVRSRKHGLRGVNAPAEVVEAAKELGEEAVALMDEAGELKDIDEAALYDNPKVREGFQKKVELLVLAANTAWRRGDLPVTPERAPSEFRKALYAQALGDFLKIHVELGETSIAQNPVIYYAPEQIRQIVADNPDVPVYYLKRLLPTNPDRLDEVMTQFRAKAAEVRAAHPHLLEREVIEHALGSPHKAATPETEDIGERLTPDELIKSIRVHLCEGARIDGSQSDDTKLEIEGRRLEICAYLEAADWNFAGIQLPETAKEALVKKIEEFIIVNERAYRRQEISTRLKDYTDSERSAVYGMVAENYALIGNILGSGAIKSWKNNPVLYVEANELAQLRSQHEHLSDRDFREIITSDLAHSAAALEKAAHMSADLKRWYPGLGDSVIQNLVSSSPLKALENAIKHIRKASENEYGRHGSIKEPDLTSDPRQVYKYLRTRNKYNGTTPAESFDEEKEKQITELRKRASGFIGRQEATADLDGKSLKKFLEHVEYCIRASEVLSSDGPCPSILELSYSAQNSIIKAIYENQREINELVSSESTNGGTKFRIHDFGFYHGSKYLKTLWKQYDAYMPRNLISYAALISPQRPMDKLNDLVEYRANLLMENPNLTPAEINRAMAVEAQDL